MTHALYTGTVVHRRLWLVNHRLEYRVFSALFDLDQIDDLAARCRLFSRNRFNLLSFFDRDHGPRDGTPIGDWVRREVAAAGLPRPDRIELLCFPRVLGQVFNPISVHFCWLAGALIAILYEVRNTFGDLHGYLVPITGDRAMQSHGCDKAFYVSPFLPIAGRYQFRVSPPADDYRLTIRHELHGRGALVATQVATRGAFTDASIASTVARHPLLAAKVLTGIHWEALKLWLKGAPFHHRPPPPAALVTVVPPS
jgi:hypothetical protein